jgi:hypothetical protein
MSYSGHARITIDHTKVTANQTAFPFLFTTTQTYLKTIANGGFIQNTTTVLSNTVPADLVFSTDQAATSLLSWEVEYYDPTTGKIAVWISTSLSSSADTVIYVSFNDASVTTFQGGSRGAAWDSNFLYVLHCLPVNSGYLPMQDSTSLAGDGTGYGGNLGPTLGTSGVIGDDLTFAGGNAKYIGVPAQTYWDFSGDFTLESWVKWANGFNNSWWEAAIVARDTGGGTNHKWIFTYDPPNSKLLFYYYNVGGGGEVFNRSNSFSPTLGTYYHVMVTRSGTTYTFYINGAAAGTATSSVTLPTQTGVLLQVGFGEGSHTIDGALDEVRISNVARSSSWISTQYNNQSDPSTFYTLDNTGQTGTLSDTINNWAEAQSLQESYSLTKSDTLTLSDATSNELTVARLAISDTLSLSDALSTFKIDLLFQTVSDSITWTDSTSRLYSIWQVELTKTVADNFIVNTGKTKYSWRDGLTVDFRPDNGIHFGIDDLSTNLQDDIALSYAIFFNSDSTQAYDTMQYNWLDDIFIKAVNSAIISNGMTLADSVSLFMTMGAQFGDTLSLSDNKTFDFPQIPFFADSMLLHDYVAVAAFSQNRVAVSDSMLQYDILNKLISTRFLNYLRRYLNDVT